MTHRPRFTGPSFELICVFTLFFQKVDVYWSLSVINIVCSLKKSGKFKNSEWRKSLDLQSHTRLGSRAALGPWANDPPCPGVCFSICKMETMTVLPSLGHSLWGPDKFMGVRHNPIGHPGPTAATNLILPDL